MNEISSWIRKKYTRQALPVLMLEYLELVLSVAAMFLYPSFIDGLCQSNNFQAIFHRKIISMGFDNCFSAWYNLVIYSESVMFIILVFMILKNFARITLARMDKSVKPKSNYIPEMVELPPLALDRSSFCVFLGEVQGRDGSRVPNAGSPKQKPAWSFLSEEALFTGVFCTGSIGTGKTSGVANQVLFQLMWFEREIKNHDGKSVGYYRFSGLVLDQKGDVCNTARRMLKAIGRENDLIEISPTGNYLWNPVFNPNIPAWANAYVLFKILQKFNKGKSGSDPFWDLSPKEITTDYLMLLDDALGYYTILDYLNMLSDDGALSYLEDCALARYDYDKEKCFDIMARVGRIRKTQDEMADGLKSSLKAVARAGLKQFEFMEMRRVFCPSKEDYFHGPSCPWPRKTAKTEEEKQIVAIREDRGILLPKENVFTGFDEILEYGKVVAINMPDAIYYDAAEFIKSAAKYAWQEAMMRREACKPGSEDRHVEPRFGRSVEYLPSFLLIDECQNIIDPEDKSMVDKIRSKRGSVWFLTQSHESIYAAFGQNKKSDANVLIQNLMTRIYFRQSSYDAIDSIKKEVDKVERYKTSFSVTEAGRGTKVDYVNGQFVDDGKAISETRTASTEEKPIFEEEHLRGLRKFEAIALISDGERTLPATVLWTRPSHLFPLWDAKAWKFEIRTPYMDWDKKYIATSRSNKTTSLETDADLSQIDSGGFLNAVVVAGPVQESIRKEKQQKQVQKDLDEGISETQTSSERPEPQLDRRMLDDEDARRIGEATAKQIHDKDEEQEKLNAVVSKPQRRTKSAKAVGTQKPRAITFEDLEI